MIKTTQPALHGVQHLPDGSDPIPGFPAIPEEIGTAYLDAIAEISAAHPGNLLGYWRLGEASSPFDDTCGLTPKPGVVDAGTPAVVTDIAGALPAPDDDGAIEFTGVGGISAQGIDIADSPTRRFNWGGSNSDITIACWVKPHADAATFTAQVIGSINVETTSPFTLYGYRLRIIWPTRAPNWERYDHATTVGGSGLTATVTGAALAADTWAFLVCTYSAATGHQMYVNGSLVGTDTTVFATQSPVNQGIRFGGGLPAGLDEVSVWNVALTAIEVGTLFTSVTSSGTAEGLVWTTDGAGGASWELPTIEVDY